MSCASCENCATDITESSVAGRKNKIDTTQAGYRASSVARILVIRFIVSFVFFTIGLALTFAFSFPFSELLARIAFVISWFVAGYRVAFYAIRSVFRGRVFDENFLMTIATLGAFIIGQWSEGAAVMLFYNLGEMVQESAVSRSRKSISELMDVRPDFARYASDNSEVHPSVVSVGSLLLVKPGEKVPLDGVIMEGSSSFDTSRLTGESIPRDVIPGEIALAGFVNGGGVLVIKSTSNYAETAAAKMLDLIENAQHRKAKAEKLITSFARVYTPIVTLGALALAVLPPIVLAFWNAYSGNGVSSFLWTDFLPWISRALVFLVISCPCAFVISVPLGFFGGIGGAAKRGILIKGADFIDVLAKTKAVIFDKTGTLTTGVLSVQGIVPAASNTEDQVLSLAASAEWFSNHPVGLAIRSHALVRGIKTDPSHISLYTEKAGYGVSMTCDGNDLRAGTRLFMEESGVTGFPERQGILLSFVSGMAVEVALDLRYVGRITLNDVIKGESALAVANLRALGVDSITMITGDTELPAREMAKKIGITDIRFGVLPHQKVSGYEEISDKVKKDYPKGTVLFVGDGINDAPTLARSDTGIAMGGMGSDAAIEAADVVLMNDNPLLVAEAIRFARWTRTIVAQNIILSFAVKIGFLLLGAIGIVTLWEAVFADVGVALLATANSHRARTLPRK